MKRLNKIKDIILEKKELCIIIVIAIISLFPLYYPGFIYTHDGIIHLFRTEGAYQNIINLDFFNRIYYNMINGQGYGWGIFYPPLSAMIPAIFMCMGISLFTSEKIFLILASIFAGIFAYKLFMELYDENKYCSMLSAILYILSPYKLNQILIRGAMGEVLAFTFMPLVLLGLIKILKGDGKFKYYFIFGMIGIVYSHIISIVYTTIFGFIFLLLNYKNVFRKNVIKDLLISSIIIIVISLPIIIPVAEHQFSNNYIISGIKTDVKDRVVHPGQLISGSFEGKEAESTGYYSNEKEMNYMIGLPFIVILLMIPFVYKDIKNEGNIKNIIIFSILFMITILMMIFPGIWNKYNILDIIQYPWRLLLYSVLFITVLCGYVLKQLVKKENQNIFFMIIVSYCLLFAFMIGINVRFAKTLNSDFNFANQVLNPGDDYGTLSFSIGYAHEYLPNNMKTEDIINKGKNIDLLEGDAIINSMQDNKNILKIEGRNNSNITKIELPLIYYKGYSIKFINKDGKVKNLNYEMSDKGFIVIELNEISDFEISAKYTGTIIYKICDYLAIIVFACFSIYVIYLNKKRSFGK